jgi:hypothetical protein
VSPRCSLSVYYPGTSTYSSQFSSPRARAELSGWSTGWSTADYSLAPGRVLYIQILLTCPNKTETETETETRMFQFPSKSRSQGGLLTIETSTRPADAIVMGATDDETDDDSIEFQGVSLQIQRTTQEKPQHVRDSIAPVTLKAERLRGLAPSIAQWCSLCAHCLFSFLLYSFSLFTGEVTTLQLCSSVCVLGWLFAIWASRD